MRSMRRAREVTSSFHELTRALTDPSVDGAAREAARRTVRDAGGVEALREAYQAASALTTSRHRTAKWTFSVLTRLERRPKRGEGRLRALEVGAINTDLMSAKFLDVRAVDIKSRHPKIEQIDFFHLPVEPEAYDVVHSSMVLNCVPTAELRGEMLRRTAVFLRTRGLFFLMLPARCVTASSRMTSDKLIRLARACGLKHVEQKSTPKVMFYCFEKMPEPTGELDAKAAAAAIARADFVRRERERDAKGDPDHFGVILRDEHVCGF